MMNGRHCFPRLIIAFSALLSSTILHAEPPHVSYIFPAGGQRGTRVDFRVGGHYLHEKCPFEMSGEDVAASPEIVKAEQTVWFDGPLIGFPKSSQKEDYPRDYLGQVTIEQDAELGVRYWRVSTSQGVTESRPFVIGELPEVVEQEIDGEPVPVVVNPPVTINGRIFPREDVDVWTFEAPAHQQLTVAVAAQQIGSPLEARLDVRDPEGQVVTESTGLSGPDPTLHFETKQAGTYQVRIHDVNLDGLQHFVYRLTITDGPWIDSVYPLGGRRGEQIVFSAAGQNVTNDLAAAIPREAPSELSQRFNLNGRNSNPVLLATDDLPEQLESEPNDAAEQARLVNDPFVANGRIDRPGDVDLWALKATKNDSLVLEIFAARLGSPLDSVLTVTDENGKELARNDDLAAGVPDSRIEFKAPDDGRFLVRVAERFSSRGGPAFAYRLRVAASQPDFELMLPSDALSVDRGGEQKLQVEVRRSGGMSEPILIRVEDLPAGVTAAAVELKGAQPAAKANLQFQADAAAPVSVSTVRIVGRAEVGGREIARTAVWQLRPGQPPVDQLNVAVAMPTPFTFSGEYAFHFVPRGGVHRKRFTIDRGDYQGPLSVALADRQTRHLQGITGSTIVVPADASEFSYPIHLPPWMELGRTSRSVLMLTGEVADESGRKHKVCFTTGGQNDQIIVRVSPSPLRPVPQRLTLPAVAGETVDLPVDVRRDARIDSPVTLQLVVPEHMRDVMAEPIVVAATEETGLLTIRFGNLPGPLNMPLVVRATSQLGDDPIVGEAKVELVPRSAPEAR